MMLPGLLLAAAAALALPQDEPPKGGVYVIAPDGDDSNPGTEAQPWKTLGRAAFRAVPGDTFRIKAGTYFSEDGLSCSRAGTASSPITYKAYGDGEVRLTNGAAIPGPWKLVQGSIYAATVPREIDSVFRNGYPLGRYITYSKRITTLAEMSRNTFFKSGDTLNVWLEDGSDPGASDMRASRSHVVSLRGSHFNVFEGLTLEYAYTGFKGQAETHDLTVRKCTLRSIHNQGLQPGARTTIEHCLFQKIGVDNHQHAMYTHDSGLVVRHNTFEEISGGAVHHFKQDGRPEGGVQVHGNLFRNPRRWNWSTEVYYVDVLLYGEGKNSVTNNVFLGEGKRHALRLASPDNAVLHNTFHQTRVAVDARQDGNRILNNIFVGADRFLVWPADVSQTADHNLYYGISDASRWQCKGKAYGTFAAYQAASGEAHSKYGDPLFVGPTQLKLQEASPARNSGLRLPEVPLDFDGLARPPGPACDIGAFQSK